MTQCVVLALPLQLPRTVSDTRGPKKQSQGSSKQKRMLSENEAEKLTMSAASLKKSAKPKSSVFSLASVLALTMMAATSCGPATATPEGMPFPQTCPTCQAPPGPVSNVPQSELKAIAGTYYGTLVKMVEDPALGNRALRQPFNLTFTPLEENGKPSSYARIVFTSSGTEIGNIEIEAYVMRSYDQYGRNIFISNIFEHALLGEYPDKFGVDLVIGFKAGDRTQVDPTQSRIYFKDCVFSQEVVPQCSNQSRTVGTEDFLGKR